MLCFSLILFIFSIFCHSYRLYHSFFFFKQKTAYEMRISDWSSDVCSSDLLDRALDSLFPVAPQFPIFERIDRFRREVAEARFLGEQAEQAKLAVQPVAGRFGRRRRARLVIDDGAPAVDRLGAAGGDRKTDGLAKSGAVRVEHGWRRNTKTHKNITEQ